MFESGHGQAFNCSRVCVSALYVIVTNNDPVYKGKKVGQMDTRKMYFHHTKKKKKTHTYSSIPLN